ncbi:MAG TPA: hypothetical protein VF421_20075 [Niabella sp.]
MNKEIIWQLLARKLSGEASETDESQLEAILKMQPELCYLFEILLDFWPLDPSVDTISTTGLQELFEGTERSRVIGAGEQDSSLKF